MTFIIFYSQSLNTIIYYILSLYIMFNEEEIYKLYIDKVKLPQSYFKKYEILPTCPVKKYNYNWGYYDFPRAWCILDFIEWINKYNITPNLRKMGQFSLK